MKLCALLPSCAHGVKRSLESLCATHSKPNRLSTAFNRFAHRRLGPKKAEKGVWHDICSVPLLDGAAWVLYNEKVSTVTYREK